MASAENHSEVPFHSQGKLFKWLGNTSSGGTLRPFYSGGKVCVEGAM